jgi:hypothetical protein
MCNIPNGHGLEIYLFECLSSSRQFIPPLHEEPNPIADTRIMEASLKDRGTVTSVVPLFVELSIGIEDTSTSASFFCGASTLGTVFLNLSSKD